MKIGIIKLRANLMLFLTALIWGATFVAQKSAMENLGPYMFNGIRCLIGAFSLFIISFFVKSRHKNKRRHLIEGGAVAGVLLFLATTLQQTGIVTTTAGKAGFISSLYIVMVPLFALISGRKIEKTVWIGVMLALLGLYFLCVREGAGGINKGDLIILFSAVFFALHIMCIAKYAKKVNAVKLSCIQFLFAGIFSTVLAFMFETTELIDVQKSGVELFYTGVLSCAIAFTLQIGAQKHVRPYIASLILSLESVFAVIAGFLFLNELLSLREIFGCILMFAAVYAAQHRQKNS
ncbi:MAG: DMT family transporter [bacterium]|nr:DMT family transporter [bacterium]